MSVIGNSPNPNDISVFKTVNKQSITGTGDSSYNLSYDVSVPEELEVFVNNVRQEPKIAYNIGSGQITFEEGIDSTDDCYIIFQGSRVGTVEPASNTITRDMLTSAVKSGSAIVKRQALNSDITHTLNHTPTDADHMLLFVNGLYQTPDHHYSVSGTTLTLGDSVGTDSAHVLFIGYS